MGKSGCGKTTLLRIIMGLEKPDAGTIKFNYVDMSTGITDKADDEPIKTIIGAVFQEDRLCEAFDAVKNAWITADRKKYTTADVRQHLLDVGLTEDDIHKPVKELSGGMKRRTAIVRAILANSELLIMDEPFTGIDDKTYESVIEYIKRNTQDKTVLLVTHRREDAKQLNADVIDFE
jgi:NitT/TauT family transport system ATP-binding protein